MLIHVEVVRVPIEEAERLLVEAESANSRFEVVVEAVKVH